MLVTGERQKICNVYIEPYFELYNAHAYFGTIMFFVTF